MDPGPAGGGAQGTGNLTPVLRPAELSSGKSVDFSVPIGWRFSEITVPKAKRSFERALRFQPDSGGASTYFIVYLSPNTAPSLTSFAGLRSRHETDNAQYQADSLEQRVVVDIIPITAGLGFISSFTDKSLVGVPIRRGDFKILTTATIYLKGDVFASCELLSDETSSVEFKSALQIISSLHVAHP